MNQIRDQILKAIDDERERQIEKGWTADHDDTHTKGQIAFGAAAYAMPHDLSYEHHDGNEIIMERVFMWPWTKDTYHPTSDNRECELIKSAAMLVAELERLRRLRDNVNVISPNPNAPRSTDKTEVAK